MTYSRSEGPSCLLPPSDQHGADESASPIRIPTETAGPFLPAGYRLSGNSLTRGGPLGRVRAFLPFNERQERRGAKRILSRLFGVFGTVTADNQSERAVSRPRVSTRIKCFQQPMRGISKRFKVSGGGLSVAVFHDWNIARGFVSDGQRISVKGAQGHE